MVLISAPPATARSVVAVHKIHAFCPSGFVFLEISVYVDVLAVHSSQQP